MGRDADCDIKLYDITSSNKHAFLRYEAGKFSLEDNESKYGTIIEMQNRMPIVPGFEKAVQIGRTILTISVEKAEGAIEATKQERNADTITETISPLVS